MHRLLQGEVGSGKTVVALRAMLQVVDAGGQAALLAPTEVLAAQHAAVAARRCSARWPRAGELDGAEQATRVALLTGSLRRGARRAALGRGGERRGRHRRRHPRAAVSEGVDFADLGLVVVDEQHRFGVEQRDALRAKGRPPPHVLVMTATPIPRTVAMTVFGDLEMSALRELPAGGRRSPPRRAGRGEAGLAGPRLAAGPRGGGGRAPGVRGLPADRRRRRRPTRTPPAPSARTAAARRWRCSTSARCSPEGPLARAAGRRAARPAAHRREGRGDARLRRRRARRAGRHHRGRGRRGRARTPP